VPPSFRSTESAANNAHPHFRERSPRSEVLLGGSVAEGETAAESEEGEVQGARVVLVCWGVEEDGREREEEGLGWEGLEDWFWFWFWRVGYWDLTGL
jgi:hypothetical protein